MSMASQPLEKHEQTSLSAFHGHHTSAHPNFSNKLAKEIGPVHKNTHLLDFQSRRLSQILLKSSTLKRDLYFFPSIRSCHQTNGYIFYFLQYSVNKFFCKLKQILEIVLALLSLIQGCYTVLCHVSLLKKKRNLEHTTHTF